MQTLHTSSDSRLLLLSPLGMIAVGHLAARLAGSIWGVWAWIPLIVLFWSMLAFLIARGGGQPTLRQWLQPPQGAWGWSLLALAVRLIPLPIFLLNWQLLKPPAIAGLWLAFALINPWFEEGYWRGVLLNAATHWPTWLSVLYTSLVFAASHPLIWGVNSIANHTPEVIVGTFLMGLAWAFTYQKTRSLRWAIVAHILVDLFNLAVPVFLNLYLPPSAR